MHSGPLGGEQLDAWNRRIQVMLDEMLKRNFLEFRGLDTWAPNANLYEDEDTFYLCVELAGIVAESISTRCIDDRLIVMSGKRCAPRPADTDEPLSVLAMEIDDGPFRREFEIPAAFDAQRVEASYDKGLLWIRLPKRRTR